MRPEVTFNSKYRDFQRQVSFHTITSKPVFLSPLELFSWLTRRNCMSSLPLTPRYHVCTQFARCSSRAQHRPSKNWYFELNVYFRQIRSGHFKKCLYWFDLGYPNHPKHGSAINFVFCFVPMLGVTRGTPSHRKINHKPQKWRDLEQYIILDTKNIFRLRIG